MLARMTNWMFCPFAYDSHYRNQINTVLFQCTFGNFTSYVRWSSSSSDRWSGNCTEDDLPFVNIVYMPTEHMFTFIKESVAVGYLLPLFSLLISEEFRWFFGSLGWVLLLDCFLFWSPRLIWTRQRRYYTLFLQLKFSLWNRGATWPVGTEVMYEQQNQNCFT